MTDNLILYLLKKLIEIFNFQLKYFDYLTETSDIMRQQLEINFM